MKGQPGCAGAAPHNCTKRQIGFFVGTLHDIVEIAGWLMCMDEQNQIEFRQAKTSRWRRLPIITRKITNPEIQMHDSRYNKPGTLP